ncbi:MAG TPA: hypothetical protein VFB72_16385 [Verrucomicrobiae bacterium]|nr:hypothetical protein [Verrucomicrobiae bacterium]
MRYKLVLAQKNQNGWPGFVAPFSTRYLNKTVTITSQATQDYPSSASSTVTANYVTDRLSGGISFVKGTVGVDAVFPYGEMLTEDPVHSETWTVTDASFTHVYNNGYNYVTTQVDLSNPYDFGTLDADLNALLSSVSIASMPWNSLIIVPGPDAAQPIGPYTPNADLMNDLLPATDAATGRSVTYTGVIAPGPNTIPNLNAAAWAIFAPGLVSSQNFFPNGYQKLIGYIAMAGNYCQRNFFIDYNQNLLNQNCVSGSGACNAPFKVTPPPITPGENAYVLIVPNCQCGD